MATRTAQMILGTPHRYHGGISPLDVLWLWENDRPAWTWDGAPGPRFAVTPAGPDRILADGLALAAAVATGPEGEVSRLLAGWLGDDWLQHRNDLSECTSYDAKTLDAALGALDFPGKVVVAAMTGSSVLALADTLGGVTWEVELLAPRFTRTRDAFGGGEWTTTGSLASEADGVDAAADE